MSTEGPVEESPKPQRTFSLVFHPSPYLQSQYRARGVQAQVTFPDHEILCVSGTHFNMGSNTLCSSFWFWESPGV